MAKVRFNKKYAKSQIVEQSGATGNEGKIYFGTDEGIALEGKLMAEVNKIDTLAVNGVSATVANKAASVTIDGADIALDGYTKAELVRAIAATDTVNTAIGILEKKIENVGTDALEEVEAGNGIIVTEKADHKQTVSAKVAEVADGDEQWLSVDGNGLKVAGIKDYVAGEIEALDVTDAAVAGQVVKAVSEADGIITVTRAALAATDIKLEKLAVPSETTLAAEYKLVNGEGATLGDTIKIAKDQFLKEVHFYKTEDDVPEGVDIPTGTEFPVIRFIFTTAAGDTESWVSVKDLVDVYTASNGVKLVGNDFQGVVDEASETFLTVGTDGFKLAGVQDAIDAAEEDANEYTDAEIAKLDATVGSQTVATGKHVAVEVVEVDGKLTGLTVTESDIASAQDLADEIARADAAEKANAAAIATEKTRAEGAEGALDARIAAFEADGDHDVAALEGRVTTAEGEIDALQADSHTHANKALLDTYTQTEANLADAVAKKHEHTNKTVLDGITAEKVTAWDGEIGALAKANEVDAALKACDATISGSDAGLSYSLTQVDGKVTAMSVELEWE